MLKGMHKIRQIVGIDEVGRGPLAGPVAVCALAASPAMVKSFVQIRESKQLSPRAREEWYARLFHARGPELLFATSFVSASVIDQKGISAAIRLALARSLAKLSLDPGTVEVLLDGGLRAPNIYAHQKTIIHGDAQETVIAMASVVAKVLRDRKMSKEALSYPQYGFERNVGYGTAEHIHAIAKHGLSPLHRRTFCANFLNAKK
jgi:ribonuclease HII